MRLKQARLRLISPAEKKWARLRLISPAEKKWARLRLNSTLAQASPARLKPNKRG